MISLILIAAHCPTISITAQQSNPASDGAIAREQATLPPGYTVFSEYRLSNETKYPAAIHDLKASIRWLRSNAAHYKIDRNRIAAVGASARRFGNGTTVPEIIKAMDSRAWVRDDVRVLTVIPGSAGINPGTFETIRGYSTATFVRNLKRLIAYASGQ